MTQISLPNTGAQPDDARTPAGARIPTDQDVYAGLRRHLIQAQGTAALYEQLLLRATDGRADLVRAHEVGADGTCSVCGGGTSGSTTTAVPCHLVEELARELGLHLRRILSAADPLAQA